LTALGRENDEILMPVVRRRKKEIYDERYL
jgi:hypothetical protein